MHITDLIDSFIHLYLIQIPIEHAIFFLLLYLTKEIDIYFCWI